MKAACLLLCCVCSIGASPSRLVGQASPAFTATGAFFALSVTDLGASTRWYSEKLGLHVTMEVPKQAKAAVTVLEGGGLTVELIQHDDAVSPTALTPPVADPVLIHGVFKVGVVIEDYPKALEVLRARQVRFAYGPFPAQGTQRANVIIRDNAGNLIQLFAR